MSVVWICVALLSGLLASLAIVVCRKRQGYTFPNYPSLLCVGPFLTLFLCLCVVLPVIRSQSSFLLLLLLPHPPQAFLKMSDTKTTSQKQKRD